jgi:CHAD domain-containing protein
LWLFVFLEGWYHTAPMGSGSELLSSFDTSWADFSKAWRKSRAKASEKSIHDLRVSTRRLIANLQLAQTLSRRDGLPKLQRRFKKVLKSMGPLRDIQVQLEELVQLPQTPLIGEFKASLDRKERRHIKDVHQQLTHGTKHRLNKDVKHVVSELTDVYESLTDAKIQGAVSRVLTARRNEFLKAERRFRRLEPVNEEALHGMRIALKKMRYVLEAAEPVIVPSAKKRARGMRTLQQLLGDSRDLEMLRAELENWAKKRGKKIAMVPALEQLREKRDSLIKQIVESPTDFEKLIRSDLPQPVSETTRAAAPVAPVRLSV